MLLRHACFVIAVGVTSVASADVLYFNSLGTTTNEATRQEWLAAIGITAGETLIDFEGFGDGENLHGVLLTGGATITHPSGEALTRSSSEYFGGSNPIGEIGLALGETGGASNGIRISFLSPVYYVGGFDIDKPGGSLWVTLTDGSETSFALDGTGSQGDSAEFWGLYQNGSTPITAIEFRDTSGGDDEWGLDNLEFGVVPEPGAFLVMGLGIAALMRRRR